MPEDTLPPVVPQYEVQDIPSKKIEVCQLLASTTSNGRKVTGQVTVSVTLCPFAIESAFQVESSIDEGKMIEITTDEYREHFEFHAENTTKEVTNGWVQDPVETGDGCSFDSLKFHFAKFPSIGKRASYGKGLYYPRLTLRSKTWQITIDVHGKCGFDAAGIATKKDGSTINRNEALDLISCLRCYLSFAFGEWCPPLLLVGTTDEAIKWRYVERFVIGEGNFNKGWIDVDHPHKNDEESTKALECGYEGFESLYKEAKWKSSLPIALSLMIQAASPQTDREVSTVISQIPLEMMSDLLGMGCNAACKLTQLLNSIKQSLDVPTILESLSRFSETLPVDCDCQANNCDKSRGRGPRAAVDVRNWTVHPTETNRGKLERYVKLSRTPIGRLFDDTTRLFDKYAVLIILNRMGFNYRYFDRIENRYVTVPWINQKSK